MGTQLYQWGVPGTARTYSSKDLSEYYELDRTDGLTVILTEEPNDTIIPVAFDSLKVTFADASAVQIPLAPATDTLTPRFSIEIGSVLQVGTLAVDRSDSLVVFLTDASQTPAVTLTATDTGTVVLTDSASAEVQFTETALDRTDTLTLISQEVASVLFIAPFQSFDLEDLLSPILTESSSWLRSSDVDDIRIEARPSGYIEVRPA